MELLVSSFNGAQELLDNKFIQEWGELKSTLEQLDLHLKASDQAGKQGALIFDPVGTNQIIKDKLQLLNWEANKPIPSQFAFLGKDIDFVKPGILVEVQFSNYPFLLNNLLRSELFFNNDSVFDNPSEILVIITKAHMYDSSNSTLYYEQAQRQLSALEENNVFDIPILLVGLSSSPSDSVPAVWTKYHSARYSRTVEEKSKKYVSIRPGKGRKSRATISFVE